MNGVQRPVAVPPQDVVVRRVCDVREVRRMRAAMTYCNRYSAIKRAARLCGVAAVVMGVMQFGLAPWLNPVGRLLVSALDASLAMQGVCLMLMVAYGRLRIRSIRRSVRDVWQWRVRNAWYPARPVTQMPARS